MSSFDQDNQIEPLKNQPSTREKIIQTLHLNKLSRNFTWRHARELISILILVSTFLLIHKKLPVFNRIIHKESWVNYLNPHKPDSVSEIALGLVIIALPIISVLYYYFKFKKETGQGLDSIAEEAIRTMNNTAIDHSRNNSGNLQLVNPENTEYEITLKAKAKKIGDKEELKKIIRSEVFTDWKDCLYAYSLAVLLTLVMSDLIKRSVGRPRPDFFNRCFPDIDLTGTRDIVDQRINALDRDFECSLTQYLRVEQKTNDQFKHCYNSLYKELSLTSNSGGSEADIEQHLHELRIEKANNDPNCTWVNDVVLNKYEPKLNMTFFTFVWPREDDTGFEPWACDEKCLTKGRRSFISGHSANAWVACFFLALYLWGKLRAFTSQKKNQSLRVLPGIFLCLFALWVIISRTSDYRHHVEDVVCGSLVGIFVAWLIYFQYYPSLTNPACNFSLHQLQVINTWNLQGITGASERAFKVERFLKASEENQNYGKLKKGQGSQKYRDADNYNV